MYKRQVRRLAENWHSAPIIEDDTPHPHPLLNEDHLAAVAKQPEPPKPVTDDDDSTHPLLDASRDTLTEASASRVSSETQQEEVARQPEIVVVSAPPDIVNISISGESLRADTPEPEEAEPPPPPPPPPLVFESPERPVPPAVAPVAPPPRVPRAMSEQRDRSSDFEPLRFLGKGTFGAVVLVRRLSLIHI